MLHVRAYQLRHLDFFLTQLSKMNDRHLVKNMYSQVLNLFHLRNKHQNECCSCTKNNENGNQNENRVLLI